MLSIEDNETITRVGPGTPMGELMRHYWQPGVRGAPGTTKPDGDDWSVLWSTCASLIADQSKVT